MFSSVTPSSSYTSSGNAPPPGCVAISISDSTSTSSTSSSWQPREGTPVDVLDTMEDPNIINAVNDPIGHRDYMSLIIFKKDDKLFSAVEDTELEDKEVNEGGEEEEKIDEYTKLRNKKIEMIKQQEILNGSSSSRFNSPNCLKVQLVAAIIFAIAFIVLFSLPDSIFVEDPKDLLPKAILSSGRGASLCVSAGGIVKARRQAVRKAEASQKLGVITAEINQILEDKKAWFEAKARRCLIDHVKRTPCYGNSKMLNKLIARGVLLQKDRIIAAAKNLLMQKAIETHWETSRGFLKLQLLGIMPNESMVNRILRPLVDAVLLIKHENSTDFVGSGLDGLLERADQLAGNTMEYYLSKARAIQREAFEARLNPPGTDLYAPVPRGIKPKKEGGERNENKSNRHLVGKRDSTVSVSIANQSLSSSRTSVNTTPLSRDSTITTPSVSTTPPKKASASSSVSPIPSKRTSTSTTSSVSTPLSKRAK